MNKQKEILRLNLVKVDQSLISVEKNWEKIDDELDLRKIGRKDTPFDADIRAKMMSAYGFLDILKICKNEEGSNIITNYAKS